MPAPLTSLRDLRIVDCSEAVQFAVFQQPDRTTLETLTRPEIHDECGFVVAVGTPNAGALVRSGVPGIVHRGEDGWGVIAGDGSRLRSPVKDLGRPDSLLRSDFPTDCLEGRIAAAHCRYGTTGGEAQSDGAVRRAAVHPVCDRDDSPSVGVMFNGNCANPESVRLTLNGQQLACDSDTAFFLAGYQQSTASDPLIRVADAIRPIAGAFSVVFVLADRVILARDPLGMRPLFIGALPSGGIAAGSETRALELMGVKQGTFEEVAPGEIVELRADGLCRRMRYTEPAVGAFCIFEAVYVQNAASHVMGVAVSRFRNQVGRALGDHERELAARNLSPYGHPGRVQRVVGIENSGSIFGVGYAESLGLLTAKPLIRQPNASGRSFIQPTPEQRLGYLSYKFQALAGLLDGVDDLFIVDDSIVRGTTSKFLLDQIRSVAPKGITLHMRSACPMILGPCFYGVATGTTEELIAVRMEEDTKKIAQSLGADSVAYLPYRSLFDAYRNTLIAEGQSTEDARFLALCAACMDRVYPTEIPRVSGLDPLGRHGDWLQELASRRLGRRVELPLVAQSNRPSNAISESRFAVC